MIKLCRCKVASYCYDLFEESEAYMRVLREIENDLYCVCNFLSFFSNLFYREYNKFIFVSMNK